MIYWFAGIPRSPERWKLQKIESQAQKRGTEWQLLRGEVGGWEWMKEGEGIRQRTYMHHPCTRTTVWALVVGWEGLEREGQRGKNWDNSNSLNNKKIKLNLERWKLQKHVMKKYLQNIIKGSKTGSKSMENIIPFCNIYC